MLTKKLEKKLQIVDLKSKKRPIAVMIDNNTGANNNNNHAGLQDAFLSYEVIVEGGLTRIMVLFKDKEVSLIGPVRSSRLYLSEPYWRNTAIAAPHNVFTTTEKLYSAAENEGYSLESADWKLLDYSFDEINLHNEQNEEDTIANMINIRYSNAQTRSYQYDQDRKIYLRSMNGHPHNDKTTLEQLHYKNIIIMQVENSTLDNYGRQDLETVGTGTGYYITNGYAKEINWEKISRKSPTKYTYKDHSKVEVNDGNTFIQVVPTIYKPEFS